MRDVRLLRLLFQQEDVIAWWQLAALGWSPRRIEKTVQSRSWRTIHVGVFTPLQAPLTRRRRWIAATLTAPGTLLAGASAGAAWGFRPWEGAFETVVRHGSGGPRRHDGLLIARSTTLHDDFTWLGPIPITAPERTLIDLSAHLSEAATGRATREAIRLRLATPPDLLAALERHAGRRGTRRLRAIAQRYANVPHTTP
jgi:hypothetical protein